MGPGPKIRRFVRAIGPLGNVEKGIVSRDLLVGQTRIGWGARQVGQTRCQIVIGGGGLSPLCEQDRDEQFEHETLRKVQPI